MLSLNTSIATSLSAGANYYIGTVGSSADIPVTTVTFSSVLTNGVSNVNVNITVDTVGNIRLLPLTSLSYVAGGTYQLALYNNTFVYK